MTEHLQRVALVTGASRGIGRAIAIELAKRGQKVILGYHSNLNLAEETLNTILGISNNAGGEIVKMDLGDLQNLTNLAEQLVTRYKKVDILVNNAGISIDRLLYEMSLEDWMKVIDVNLNANFLLTRSLLRPMVRARWGRIINIASISAQAGNAGQCNYSASKAGIIGLSKSLAKEMAKRNITVNVVSPGVIDTDMIKGTVPDELKKFIPMGKIGTPAEVAKVVAFLASDDASYITGQLIGVNGGLYM